LRSVVAVALVGLASARCTRTPPAGDHTVIDDLGRRVHVSVPVSRIVSLSPAFTDLLFALGAGDLLVGRTRYDTYPPEAEAVPSIGEGMSPNVELVVARHPQLVLFYASGSNAAAIAQLDNLGIASISLAMDRLESVPRAARLLGPLIGRSEVAERVAESFDAELRNRPAPVDRPTVAILAWDNPPIVIGRGSFLSQLIEYAGARNAFDDVDRPSAQVSIEAIADRQPDVFLTLNEELPAFAERPEWQVVEAVRHRRFIRLRGAEFGWPSVRAFQAVQQLASALADLQLVGSEVVADTTGANP
jgi:iron complex transport system substrate-binding protein